jgi:alkylhydroperoxidase family enzyme
MLPLGRFLLSRHCAIDRRLREIVIDRVTARCGCEYEWGVHVAAFAGTVGLDDARVRATAVGRADDPAWSPDEALVVRLVDELHDTGQVGDTPWKSLAARFGANGCLELLVLVGWYHLISFVANGAEVALEPWAARFPAPHPGDATPGARSG